MSPRRPTPVEKPQLDFICHDCGAQPQEWCVTRPDKNGVRHIASTLHASRFYAARDAGLLPLGDAP